MGQDLPSFSRIRSRIGYRLHGFAHFARADRLEGTRYLGYIFYTSYPVSNFSCSSHLFLLPGRIESFDSFVKCCLGLLTELLLLSNILNQINMGAANKAQ